MKKYGINVLFILFSSVVFSFNAHAVEHAPKQPNFFVPKNVLQQIQAHHHASTISDNDCQQRCRKYKNPDNVISTP